MIAILGWGSLLWEDAPEFDRWHDDWRLDGPTLPLEFSRVSTRREGALTLVIDHEAGSPTVVAWTRSRRCTLDDAVADLRCREGTIIRNIGRYGEDDSVSRNDRAHAAIADWARSCDERAVIWTALPSNFHETTKEQFSIEAAKRYLDSLPPRGKVKAAEYIRRAPQFVRTSLRAAVEIEPWFPGG